MKKLLFVILCIFGAVNAYAVKMKVSDIYQLAKENKTEELAKVTNLNGHDMYKDTALCHAIKDGDINAYNALKQAGANTEHACVKKIPSEQYNEFLQKVTLADKPAWSLAGIGKWAWGLLGVGAGVAAGAVIAGSGSDGDSNGSAPVVLNCVHGTQNGNSCTCDTGYIGELCDTLDTEHYIEQNGQIYQKLNCQNGGTQNANTCNCVTGWTGTLCDTAHNCDAEFTQTSCGTGYLETGTCKSGNTTYVSCSLDEANYIEQGGVVYQKLNCQNGGTQNANTCNCVTGWTGTLCETAHNCGAGFTQTSCSTGYIQTGTCKSGDTTYVSCSLDTDHYIEQNGQIYQKLNCVHGIQNGNSCTCNTGYIGGLCDVLDSTNYIEQNGQIYQKLNCVHGTQNGNSCTCNTGYIGGLCDTLDSTNYIEQNGQIYQKLNCVHGTQNGNTCACNTGYIGELCDTLDSTNYIEQNGQIYPKLNCQNGGTQNANTCNCVTGWTGTLCDTAHNCDAEFTQTSCGTGYLETGTCKSGNTTYVSCSLDEANYIEQGGVVYPKLNCQNGGSQVANTCSCIEGWEGTLCETPHSCSPANEGSSMYEGGCPEGYYITNVEICQSGNTSYSECAPIPLNCSNGHQEGTACMCDRGWTGTLCDQFDDTNYFLDDGQIYDKLNCVHGSQVANTCSCIEGWEGTLCDTPHSNCSNGHQEGTACMCDRGWTGTLCDQFDDTNYFLDPTDGQIYDKLNCVHGNQVANTCVCEWEGWEGDLCDIPHDCGAGYKLECTGGYETTYNSCFSGNDILVECRPIQCGANAVWSESGCISMSSITDCGSHAYKQNGICVCEPGYENWTYGVGCQVPGINDTENPQNIYINSTTDGDICGIVDGYVLDTDTGWPEFYVSGRNVYITKTSNGNVCGISAENFAVGNSAYFANKATLYIDKTGVGEVIGILGTGHDWANAHSVNIDSVGNIIINNSGHGKIYGIKGDSGARNSDGFASVGTINIHNTNNNEDIFGIYSSNYAMNVWPEGASGIIDITNYSDSNIYGIYSQNGAYNANGGLGIININNNGDGNIYGLYGKYANNGLSDAAGVSTAYININNIGDGDVWGIYASTGVSNAEGGDEYINIINYGDGSVYGLYSQNGNAYNNGEINITNEGGGDVYGLYSQQDGNVYNSGEINITNNGDADVYGLYSQNNTNGYNTIGNAYNVHNGGTGTININNEGDGNVYGLYSQNNKSYSQNKGVYNVEGGGAGEINITNNGSGDTYGLYSIKNDAYNVHSDGIGEINITNNGAGNVYGLYSDGLYSESSILLPTRVANLYGGINDARAEINIDNYGNGNVYGLYNTSIHNSLDSLPGTSSVIQITNYGNVNEIVGLLSNQNINSDRGYAVNIWKNNDIESGTGLISIIQNGTGDVYGMKAHEVINVGSGHGIIQIINNGPDNAYGMYGYEVSSIHAAGDEPHGVTIGDGLLSDINIINAGGGDAYGMYGYNTVYNDCSPFNNNIDTGLISIQNIDGNAIGIHVNKKNGDASGEAVNRGKISINNIGVGTVVGMHGEDDTGVYNESTIMITRSSYTDGDTLYTPSANVSSDVFGIYVGNVSTASNLGGKISVVSNGKAYGIYAGAYSAVDNVNYLLNDDTGIHVTTDWDAYGIYVGENSTVTNSDNINVTSTNGTAYGIYAKSGSTVNNSGKINITTNNTNNAYGIYVEGNSTVTNSGTITLNGVSCNGASCDGSSSYGNHIVLNGSSLVNNGVLSANTLNLNSMGGKVVAGLGSQFVIENELSGDLNIGADIVQNGNQTTYVAENMIDAGDTSGLNLISDSAMFDASLADNGNDVVMTMKQFTDLTDNASLAQFLADNYANGNGSELFAALKSMENMSAFNGALAGLTGLDTFTQFAHEDLSAMREISFSMNNKLFENSGRDSFDISDSMGYFSFSDSHNGGSGRYGISNDKITDKLKLGYGMAMANINTNDGHGMNRQNKMWLFYMPLTYTDEGYELVIAPKAGFANSEYNRRGYNNMNYEGVIEKRIFGLMNDLRYPLTFGNWTFAPDFAFNTIVYTQSGHEEDKEFALVIPDDRTVSVETGLGLYTKYEKTLQDGSRFKLNSGLMVYREFGDTYDIKLGIRGMDGTFSLYNNDYEYRGAASIGFDYTAGRLHVYGNAQYFMDNANYANFKGGVSYRF